MREAERQTMKREMETEREIEKRKLINFLSVINRIGSERKGKKKKKKKTPSVAHYIARVNVGLGRGDNLKEHQQIRSLAT